MCYNPGLLLFSKNTARELRYGFAIAKNLVDSPGRYEPNPRAYLNGVQFAATHHLAHPRLSASQLSRCLGRSVILAR